MFGRMRQSTGRARCAMTINSYMDWTNERIRSSCGAASLTPSLPVPAGEYGSWTLVFTAGEYGMDIGSTVKIVWRLASDWGYPQFDRPEEPNFSTVRTSNRESIVKARFDRKGHIRPWSSALIIDVVEEALSPGDTITVVLGDRSEGSAGMRTQTFADDSFAFRVLVDPFATGCFVRLPDDLSLPVRPGPVESFRVVGPGSTPPRSPVTLSVYAMDAWGNPVRSYDGELRLTGPTEDEVTTISLRRRGHVLVERRSGDQPVQRFTLLDSQGAVLARSNPILCTPLGEESLYWGDIHGQSGETVGTGDVKGYFAFARDVARLEFSAHAANDFQVSRKHYEDICTQVRRYHEPGRFVTFLAYEWSGNTPAGGDHNVYFLHDDEPMHRSSHWQLDDWRDETTDRHPIDAVYRQYEGRSDVLVIPHIGGRRANLAFHSPSLSPFIEISSVHGRFEWFAKDALQRGLEVGFVANSDDHSGRPGAAFPTERHRVRGGLMGAWARDLSREALWEAFKMRRVYGTSGERIGLHFSADGHPMGSSLTADGDVRLQIDAWGTAGIERVEIWRGTALWHTHRTAAPDPSSGRLKVAWSGARSTGRNRRLVWDGSLLAYGAIFGQVTTFGFDSPLDGVRTAGPQSLSWVSSTVGDVDGILVNVHSMEPGAHVLFDAVPCKAVVRLADLAEGEVRIPGGGVDAEVHVAWAASEELPLEVHLGLDAPSPETGSAPYWVRVVQTDGEMAWSSPVFVTKGA